MTKEQYIYKCLLNIDFEYSYVNGARGTQQCVGTDRPFNAYKLYEIVNNALLNDISNHGKAITREEVYNVLERILNKIISDDTEITQSELRSSKLVFFNGIKYII